MCMNVIITVMILMITSQYLNSLICQYFLIRMKIISVQPGKCQYKLLRCWCKSLILTGIHLILTLLAMSQPLIKRK